MTPVTELFGRALTTRLFVPLLALAVSLAPGSASAQTEATGTITGRVLNLDTASYLNNARVRVAGTTIQALTNQFGEYRLTNVPAGQVTLDVFYTGIPTRQVTVTVPPGGSVTQDVELSRDTSEQVMRLSEFVVQSEREMEAAAIAINEQRFAAARKDVVSTDAFGEINQGNIGEFVKFLPGISLDVKDGNTPSGIMVRGFDPNYTNVTLDGGQMASTIIANTQTSSRQFVLEGMNINNIARIEVVKLPTPDMQANVLGGAVNFITKSAFERARPEFRVSLSLSGNEKALDFEKTPGPFLEDTYKIRPSFDVQYVNPVNKRFGYVITAQHSSQYYLQNQAIIGYRFGGNPNPQGTNPTRAVTEMDPFINSINTRFAPNRSDRTSGGLTLDFRPWDHSTIRLTGQASVQKQQSSARNINYQAGNNTPLDWNQHNTLGAATGGNVSMGTSFQERHAQSRTIAGSWEFRKDDWLLELAGTYSNSNNRTRDIGKGFFRAISVSLPGVSRVNLLDVDTSTGKMREAQVFNSAGQRIDELNLANWRLTQASNASEPLNASDDVKEARFNATRALRIGRIPFSLKAGASVNDVKRDLEFQPFAMIFVGPDGVQNSADDFLGNYVSQGDLGVSPGFGRPAPQWPDPFAIYQTFVDNPSWWSQTVGQGGDAVRNRAVRSPWFHETITAGYIMADTKLLDNRLRLVGGVRYELTESEGWGVRQDATAVYQKDAQGNPIRVNNRFVRLPQFDTPTTGPGSAAWNTAIYQYRNYYNARDYHTYHPSAAATYNITENLLIRAAFAKTIGRPNISDIVPNINVSANESFTGDAGQFPGFITASNPSLRPWTAKNYDYSIEYYLPKNGVVMFNVFRKDIKNFFGSINQTADQALLDELGIEDSALGYRYTRRINIGDARITGWEARIDYPLANLTTLGEFISPIGDSWARHFTLMANFTHLDLQGSRIGPGDWKRYIPRGRNFGVRWAFPKLTGNLLVNWRGRMVRDTNDDFEGAAEYIKARYQVDGSLEYQITKRYSAFFAVRNLLNAKSEWEVAGPGAPEWAWLRNVEDYGAQYTLGVRAVF